MGEKALKWAFKLLGIALVVVPLVVALSAADWDLKAAVLPNDQELSQVQSTLADTIGSGSASQMYLGKATVVGSNLSMPVTLKSSLNMPMKVKELTGSATIGTQTVQLRLKEEVEVPKKATVIITLVGAYSGPAPASLAVDGVITVEVFGVSVSFSVKMI